MRRIWFFSAVMLMVFGCIYSSGCTKTEPDVSGTPPALALQNEEPDTESEYEDEIEVRAAEILSNMTVEQKIGQMFFVPCPSKDSVKTMKDYQFGGYILYKPDFQDSNGEWLNARQIENMLNKFKNVSKVDPFFGVDEEGGSVVRIGANPKVFSEISSGSQQDIWKKQGVDALFDEMLYRNSTLREIGITVNLAPVADVVTDKNAFMYDRSMGADAETTAELIKTVVSAMSESRMGSVLKHFPGYGNNGDTHKGTVVDERPYEQFVSEDFLPFISGIEAGADAVMMSHNIATCMDGELPASLSPEVHRVLREELGFDGVIMTDDLIMAGAKLGGDVDLAVLSIEAGNDMIVTGSYKKAFEGVIIGVKRGDIEESRIDESVMRILKWKLRLGVIE